MTTRSTTHKQRQSLLFLSFITLKIMHILLLVLYHQLLICKRGATLHTNSTDMTTKQNNSCGSIQLNPIKPLNLNSQQGLLRRSLVVAGRAVMFEIPVGFNAAFCLFEAVSSNFVHYFFKFLIIFLKAV